MSPSRLWPLTDCTINYRPVLSSERAPQDEEQRNCPAKKKNLVMGPKGVPDTKTDRPTDRRSQHQLNSMSRIVIVLLIYLRHKPIGLIYAPILRQFSPLHICTINYRPVLSSERALQDEEQRNCPAKKKIWLWSPKECPTPRLIGQLTVGHNTSSTQCPELW
jgi:hypothetical protein